MEEPLFSPELNLFSLETRLMRTTLEVCPDATMEDICAKRNYLESATTLTWFYAADGEFNFYLNLFAAHKNRRAAGMYF